MERLCYLPGVFYIVEDDYNLAYRLAENLKIFKREIHIAYTSKEFVRKALRTQQNLALVLLDIMLPCLDGRTLIPQIKNLNPLTKIIVITGKKEDTLELQVHFKGADDFLEKPFPMSLLIQKVKRRLEIPCATIQDLQFHEETYRIRETFQASRTRKVKLARDIFYLPELRSLYIQSKDKYCYFTYREDLILRKLVFSQGAVVPTETFASLDWIRNAKALATWISRINKKLRICAEGKLRIKSVYGVGYLLKQNL